MRRLPSFSQKTIRIFCLVLNTVVFNTSCSLTSSPSKKKKRKACRPSSFLAQVEGLAHYSCSLPVHNLRRLPSFSQKTIRIFCLVLNTVVFNTSCSLTSSPSKKKKRKACRPSSFLAQVEGLAHYSCSLPVHNLRRLPSFSQKTIRIFCLVLNTVVFNTSCSLTSSPSKKKKRKACRPSSFLAQVEGLAHYSCSLPVHNLRRLPSFSQKTIRIFCLVLNTVVFNTSCSLTSSPSKKKKRKACRPSSFLAQVEGLEPPTGWLTATCSTN